MVWMIGNLLRIAVRESTTDTAMVSEITSERMTDRISVRR